MKDKWTLLFLVLIISAFSIGYLSNCTSSFSLGARATVSHTLSDSTEMTSIGVMGYDYYADFYLDTRPLEVDFSGMIGFSLFGNSVLINQSNYGLFGGGLSIKYFLSPIEDEFNTNTFIGSRIGIISILDSASPTTAGFDFRLSGGVNASYISFYGSWDIGLEAFVDYQSFGLPNSPSTFSHMSIGVSVMGSLPTFDLIWIAIKTWLTGSADAESDGYVAGSNTNSNGVVNSNSSADGSDGVVTSEDTDEKSNAEKESSTNGGDSSNSGSGEGSDGSSGTEVEIRRR